MKLAFSLQLKDDNKSLEVNKESLALCGVQAQTLAIIAHAYGMKNAISTFTNKDGEQIYFVSREICAQLLEKISAS